MPARVANGVDQSEARTTNLVKRQEKKVKGQETIKLAGQSKARRRNVVKRLEKLVKMRDKTELRDQSGARLKKKKGSKSRETRIGGE